MLKKEKKRTKEVIEVSSQIQKVKKVFDYHSIGLWMLVAVLFTSFSLNYLQTINANSTFVRASEGQSDYFTIGVCENKKVFGIGNQQVGHDRADFGCFDSAGKKIGDLVDLTRCRQLACGE